MTKKVKITVNGMPITTISSPLTMGTHGPVVLDTKDIFKCIIAGAKVVEVFENYGEVVLTLSNYDKDNTPYIKAAVVKTVMDNINENTSAIDPLPNTDNVAEYESETPEELDTTEDIEENAEDGVESVTETPKTDEQPKVPEHWMPPQRGNNQTKNNNSNKGNKGKGR